MKRTAYVYLVLFGLSPMAVVNGQNGVKFVHVSVRDGLSHNTVNCILQDRDGFIWIGTNDGLNRYDGHTFTVYRPDPAQPSRSLLSNRISGLYQDRSARLWIATEGGGTARTGHPNGPRDAPPHYRQQRQSLEQPVGRLPGQLGGTLDQYL